MNMKIMPATQAAPPPPEPPAPNGPTERPHDRITREIALDLAVRTAAGQTDHSLGELADIVVGIAEDYLAFLAGEAGS